MSLYSSSAVKTSLVTDFLLVRVSFHRYLHVVTFYHSDEIRLVYLELLQYSPPGFAEVNALNLLVNGLLAF